MSSSEEWKGDWSDNSYKWTEELKNKLDYNTLNDGFI